jgi:hypothetical protein
LFSRFYSSVVYEWRAARVSAASIEEIADFRLPIVDFEELSRVLLKSAIGKRKSAMLERT